METSLEMCWLEGAGVAKRLELWGTGNASLLPASSFLLSMASSDGTACGGYDYSFVDGDPPDEYQCHICTLVARGKLPAVTSEVTRYTVRAVWRH